MESLPDLPFEQVLSYLSLKELIKCRAVSRNWNNKVDSFRVKTLCYSEDASGFIYQKGRLINGQFAQNFISSRKFQLFFKYFSRSILANLKHLRFCDLGFTKEDAETFAPTLNSFGQLQKLDIINLNYSSDWNSVPEFDLNLPMLHSIQLDKVFGVEKLQVTLNSPKLKKVKLLESFLRLDIVHYESVEKLISDSMDYIAVKKFKNLKYLYTDSYEKLDSTFLPALPQLKEIHVIYSNNISQLFEQKQNGRADLKIFFFGVLVNGPDDPGMRFYFYFHERETFVHLAENPSKLADEIPNRCRLNYEAIERVVAGLENNFVARLTDLNEVRVGDPVKDVQRFLDFLTNFDNIVHLKFSCAQPQDLFDRLPEHSAVQWLEIYRCSEFTDFFGFYSD